MKLLQSPIKTMPFYLLHKPYSIDLTLWGEIIIGPTKKLVTLYVVEDLVLLN